MNKTQLAEKRYTVKNYNNQLQKPKSQKKKQYEINKRRAFIEKQNKSNKKNSMQNRKGEKL